MKKVAVPTIDPDNTENNCPKGQKKTVRERIKCAQQAIESENSNSGSEDKFKLPRTTHPNYLKACTMENDDEMPALPRAERGDVH